MKRPSHLLPMKLHFPENSSQKSHRMGREVPCGSHMSQTLTFDADLLNLTSYTKPKSSWMPQEQRGSRRIYSEVTTCCLKLSGTPLESTSHPPGLSCISKTDNSQKCWHWLGGVNDWLLVQCPRVVLVPVQSSYSHTLAPCVWDKTGMGECWFSHSLITQAMA